MPLNRFTLTADLAKKLESENYYFSNKRGATDRIGSVLYFQDDVRYSKFSAMLKSNQLVSMGMYSYSWSRLPTGATVGNYSSIARDCELMEVRHPTDRFTTSSFSYDRTFLMITDALDCETFKQVEQPQSKSGISIGHDVWIGAGCLFAQGLTIGNGAIVGARSVVTKSVPPYTVFAGSPASIKKQRFSDRMCEALQVSQWYNYDVRKLPIRADVEIDSFLYAFSGAQEAKTIEKITIPDLFKSTLLAIQLTINGTPP